MSIKSFLKTLWGGAREKRALAPEATAEVEAADDGAIEAMLASVSTDRYRDNEEARKLRAMGEPAVRVLSRIVRDTPGADEEWKVVEHRIGLSSAAAGLLGSMGKQAIPALGDLLLTAPSTIQIALSEALRNACRELKSEALDALPALLAGLCDDSDAFSVNCIEAIGHIGPAAKEAIPALKVLVRENRTGFIHNPSKTACYVLRSVFNVHDSTCRDSFRDLEELVRRLQSVSNDPSTDVTDAMNRGITLLIRWYKTIKPVTHDDISDMGTDLQFAEKLILAMQQVLEIGGERLSRATLSQMVELGDITSRGVLSDSGPVEGATVSCGAVRERAERILVRSHEGIDDQLPPNVLTYVCALLNNQDGRSRGISAAWLAQLKQPSSVPALVRALHDHDASVRRRVVDALGRIATFESLRAIVPFVDDPDGYVSLSAIEALEKQTTSTELAGAAIRNTSCQRFVTECRYILEFGDTFASSSFFQHEMEQIVGRCEHVIEQSDFLRLGKLEQVTLYWYAGLLGLRSGVDPRRCLAFFQKGTALSLKRQHDIVPHETCLRYILAVLAGDYAGAKRIRELEGAVDRFKDHGRSYTQAVQGLLGDSEELMRRCREHAAQCVQNFPGGPGIELDVLFGSGSGGTWQSGAEEVKRLQPLLDAVVEQALSQVRRAVSKKGLSVEEVKRRCPCYGGLVERFLGGGPPSCERVPFIDEVLAACGMRRRP